MGGEGVDGGPMMVKKGVWNKCYVDALNDSFNYVYIYDLEAYSDNQSNNALAYTIHTNSLKP